MLSKLLPPMLLRRRMDLWPAGVSAQQVLMNWRLVPAGEDGVRRALQRADMLFERTKAEIDAIKTRLTRGGH